MKLLVILLPLATAAATMAACSSSGDSASAPSFGVGPAIPAAQVGGACSGVGTSPGDSAVFEKAACAAGYCVADARKGFDSYCTAECEAHSCPSGYLCQAITLGDVKHACLRDASAPRSGADPGMTTGKPDASQVVVPDAGRDAAMSGGDSATEPDASGPLVPHDCDTRGSASLTYFGKAAQDPKGACPCFDGQCCYRPYPGPVCVVE